MSGRKIIRLGLDAVSVVLALSAAWGFGRAWLSGEADVMEWLSLTPGFAMQIYAGLMAGSLVVIIGLHWEFLQSRRPSQRFKKLNSDIHALRRRRGDLMGYESELEALRLNLRDIRVHGPDPFADIDDWVGLLNLLDAYSKDGRIKEARNLFDKPPSIFVRLMRMLKKVN